jgi:hypothetical protein
MAALDQHAADHRLITGIPRTWRHLGDSQHARRSRIRRIVASGWHAREEAECVR